MYKIQTMTKDHWPECSRIYEEGIKTGKATFALNAPSYEDWDREHRKDCRLVITDDGGKVAGWAAVGQAFVRKFYHGVVELSLYIGEGYRGKGLGTKLMKAEIAECEKSGIWTIQSLIMAENEASIALHKKCGFLYMCTHKHFGQEVTGRWRDVVRMEYRSETVGV